MGRHEYDLATQARKPTNVSLDIALVAEAKRLGINISRACEVGLTEQIAKERGRLWKEENASALESSNSYVDRRGLPLGQYRRF
ncbi:type II toxin-antitoxin system CcdA family antitoxin [Sphingobium sp. EM0848]|uniref:type II toxin-antitoxin system CcdA family antitoxin n=1 Tax=Sphingobium sp. EM0848 TaxID=2743473 RepID=UPI00159C5772|nr:type II toxin-antitoxin system CcdA family antitoxin [Sphingobium sp. EM0848]